MAFRLAELFVELGVRGFGKVTDALGGVHKQIDATASAAQNMNKTVGAFSMAANMGSVAAGIGAIAAEIKSTTSATQQLTNAGLAFSMGIRAAATTGAFGSITKQVESSIQAVNELKKATTGPFGYSGSPIEPHVATGPLQSDLQAMAAMAFGAGIMEGTAKVMGPFGQTIAAEVKGAFGQATGNTHNAFGMGGGNGGGTPPRGPFGAMPGAEGPQNNPDHSNMRMRAHRAAFQGQFAGNDGGGAFDALAAQRRQSIRMSRISRTFGGAQAAGSEFTERVKQLAISKQEEGFFQRSQKYTLLRVAAMQNLSKSMTGVLLASGRIAESFGKVDFFLGKIQTGTAAFVRAATIGFAALTGGVLAFVTAGLRGTGEGARLSYLFDMLSKQIAGIFLPLIRMITDGLESMLGWFMRLTGEQQRSYLIWAITAGAVLGYIVVLGQMLSAVILLVEAVMALNAALAFMGVASGNIKGVVAGIAIGAAVLGAGVGIGTYLTAKSKLGKKPGDARDDVSAVGGTAESFGQTYARIQQTAANVGPLEVAKNQLTVLQSIDNRLMQMNLTDGRRTPIPAGMRP